MARDQIDMTPIETRDELVAWLEEGCKPKAQFRIGTEHEKFAFTVDGHRPVPMTAAGIRALLEGMQHLLGWEPIMEGENIIGLFDVTGGGAISLEPGGQFELSGAPVETVHQTAAELIAHLAQVREVAKPLGIGFLGLGMTPNWTRAETPMMPKGRYKIMTDYMPKVGKLGLDMMYRTCTVQVNLDFSSEADMVKKLRVVARAAAGRHRAVRQFAFHRGQAERLPLLPLAKSGATPTTIAPACCPWPSRTAWASSAMSITRSTCRCISSSAATTTSTSSGKSFRDFFAGKLRGAAGRARRRSPTGPTTLSTIFPRCGSSAISKCAAPTAGRGGGCPRSPPSGSACSTTTMRSTRAGTW